MIKNKKGKGADSVHKSQETYVLERTLKKIANLLNIGFGEAGTQIIAHNMRSAGRIDGSVEGVRVRGAFGFCDIRQFTDATGARLLCLSLALCTSPFPVFCGVRPID